MLWRVTGFFEDDWTEVADDAPIPAQGPIVVGWGRWTKEREALASRAAEVGLRIDAGKDARGELEEAAGRPFVALNFAKFSDGRAYSYASLLRERYGFKGELRGFGDILLDSIPLMLRCGFSSFEITNAPTLAALKRGHVPEVFLHTQPSPASDEPREAGPPWRRRTTPLGAT